MELREYIANAKDTLGFRSAEIIANDLKIEGFNDGNMKGLCPFHDEDTPSFAWYPEGNYFKCFGCGKVYDIVEHYMKFYKLSFSATCVEICKLASIQPPDIKQEKERQYRYPKYKAADNTQMVQKYLKSRGISAETMEHCQVDQDYNSNLVWKFFDENDVLRTVKIRNFIKPPEKQKEFYLPGATNDPILYNMNKIDVTKPLVITEGQVDALSVIEAGYSNCVSVPSGTENLRWIELCYDFLENFDQIIVWSDNDAPGVKMRKEASSRLGVWRTKFVDLPDVMFKDGKEFEVKDANDVLCRIGKEAVLDLIANATEVPLTGVADLADVDDFDIEKAPGLYTCLREIDKIIYKFIFGSLVVLTGVKGSGKSTFLNQAFVCEPLNQGHDVFVFSGELSGPVIRQWIETTMAGRESITMKNEFVRIIEPKARTAMKEWYRSRVWLYDDRNNNSAEAILDKAVTLIRRFGVKVIILDNLMTIDIGSNDNNLWQKQKEFAVKLANLAITYNVLIVLVAHPRKTGSEIRRIVADDVSGSNDIGNIAQYIVGVHRFSDKEKEGELNNKGEYKRGHEPIEFDVDVDIFKNRYTGKIGSASLYFDYPSYRFYRTPEELWKRYKWSKSLAPTPKNDPNKHGPAEAGWAE
jgi:twinkle protein